VRPPVQGLAEGSAANEDYAPDFSVDYMIKDLSCVLRTTEALRVQADTVAITHQLFIAASAAGDGGKDISILGRLFD